MYRHCLCFYDFSLGFWKCYDRVVFFLSYFVLGSYNADEGGTLGITVNFNMFLPEGVWSI
jgi:hypothetical protein